VRWQSKAPTPLSQHLAKQGRDHRKWDADKRRSSGLKETADKKIRGIRVESSFVPFVPFVVKQIPRLAKRDRDS
jgi:hypothetical protein